LTSLKPFFTVSARSIDPSRYHNRLKLNMKYTSIFCVAREESVTPPNPIIMFNRKNFCLSYADLEKHVIAIGLWEVSCWTFNSYLGYEYKPLSDIANADPNMDLIMKKKVPKRKVVRGRKAKAGDVAKFSCTINLEEIFEFQLAADNWTLEISKDYPASERKKLQAERKRLSFIMPKNIKSRPGSKGMMGDGCTTKTTEWNPDAKKFFWPRCGTFRFTGTRSHLRQSFFIVAITSGDPPDFVVQRPSVQKLQPSITMRILGKCLINLTSVLEVSVFKGEVKRKETQREKYIVGELGGNVKGLLISKGFKSNKNGGVEHDLRDQRPEQSPGSVSMVHLNKHERYLVVRVKKCEALPGSDETGLSDPFLRVSWDNMVQTSPINKQTVRPVFNHSFYFPVRIVFQEITPSNEKKYEKDILYYEIQSKGPLNIEVWDDDESVSADFLGRTILDLHDILAVRSMEKRSLLGAKPRKNEDKEDGNEMVVPTKLQWFEEEKSVRAFNGSKVGLIGATVTGSQQPLIYYEAYFYPDFPATFRFEERQTAKEDTSMLKKKEIEWNDRNSKRQEKYAKLFPDSIGAKPIKDKERNTTGKPEMVRRFLCTAQDPQKVGDCILTRFLSKIIIPEDKSYPAYLLHWVNCLTFDMTTQQARYGLIPQSGWKDPDFILARRRGTPQDHAVLLCSLLLGCRKDAYVVKGTIQSKKKTTRGEIKETLTEHVWVMTREEGGWVTFWEPTSRQLFHLPSRHTKMNVEKKPPLRRKQKHLGEETTDDEVAQVDDECGETENFAKLEDNRWEGQVPDQHLKTEDLDALPTIGRQPRPKIKAMGKKKDDQGRKENQQVLAAARQNQTISPDKALLKDNKVVNWLPYDSIEVVFNETNVWANCQSHHPACMMYDFPVDDAGEEEQPQKWDRFLKDDAPTFPPMAPDVNVAPELKSHMVQSVQEDLRNELMQNLYLYRSKKGFDSLYEHGPNLMERIRTYLEIQESFLQIDPDIDHITKLMNEEDLKDEEKYIKENFYRVRQWNKYGSPYFNSSGGASGKFQAYKKDQDALWKSMTNKVKNFVQSLDTFPTKRGRILKGFPVHFSTSDKEQIRNYLMSVPEYVEYIDIREEDVFYTIECKITALLGGVLSVWIYFGIHMRATEENKKMQNGEAKFAPLQK